MRPNCLEHAEIIPHKHVVGDGNGTVLQFLLVIFQVLAAVDPQSVCQVRQGEHDKMKQCGYKCTVDTEPKAVRHIVVMLVQMQRSRAFEHQHMLVAPVGIRIVEVMTVIHKRVLSQVSTLQNISVPTDS